MGSAVETTWRYTSDLNNLVSSAFCSFVFPAYCCRFSGKPLGRLLVPSSKPSQSFPDLGLLVKSLNVDCVLNPKLNPRLSIFFAGTSFVCTCTSPPANSPVISGVAVLLITILSINTEGITSKLKTFLSGSELGS